MHSRRNNFESLAYFSLFLDESLVFFWRALSIITLHLSGLYHPKSTIVSLTSTDIVGKFMNVAVKHTHTSQYQRADIHVRKDLDFKINQVQTRYWYENSAIKTRIFDAICFTFPEGERYFISSVRAFRNQITNPELKARVADFIKQEAQHGIAHDKMNQHIEKQGMPVAAMRLQLNKMLNTMLENRSAKYNLAFTAASEHLTAMMADAFYTHKSTLAHIEPNFRALLAWHAIEEMEHRDVAFDVMSDVAQISYFPRAFAMVAVLTKVGILDVRLINQLIKADGYTLIQRIQLYREGISFTFGKHGVFTPMIKPTLSWFKPNFHPNKHPVIAQYPVWVKTLERTNDPIAAGEAFWAAGK